MSNDISIHLSTYLKDSGIKATRQQVDKLARDIQRINRDAQGGVDKTVQALGKLPGAFGKLQGVVSGFGAKAMAVIAAFKVGWDVGTWIKDKIIWPLFKVKDPIEELKKHNRELRKEAEAAAKAFENWMSKSAAGWDAEAKGARDAVKLVDKLAQSYLKLQNAREQVASAGEDSELLGMRRDKFNAMAGAQTPEQAAQLGKYHDVLIAELEAKQQLAKFDRGAESSAKQLEAEEKKLRIATRHVKRVEAAIGAAEEKLRYLKSDEAAFDMGPDASKAAEEKMLARLEKLKEERRAAEAEEDELQRSVWAAQESAKAAPQVRQNIIDAAKLEIDEKKKAYNDYIAQVEAEDYRRAEEEWNRQQEEIRREAELELRERQKVEQQIAAQRLADLRNELSERQHMEGEARSRQSAADSALSSAWGLYRDKSRMQAVIDERKAQAAAEVQWAKDFERLKTWRRDWRTAEFGSLSAADEAVRQVAFAKEEKAAADRAVIETAENTRDLAKKLDDLIQMK